jgi:queuosine precursor transporter
MVNKTNTIVFIIGLYVACQLIADVGATKMVQIGSVILPGGTFMFAVSFVLRDMIHRKLGKEWAKAAIYMAAFLNVIMIGYFWFITQLGSPVFYQYEQEWGLIFALVPSIVIASIIAEVVSQLLNTEVYHWWSNRFSSLPLWTRSVSSNVVSLPIDSVIFGALAFTVLPLIFGGDSISFFNSIVMVAGGQTLYKIIVALVFTPLIYTVSNKD